MGHEDVVLYAYWTSEPTYKVFYSNNGADSGNVPVDDNHYLAGQTVTVISNTGGLIKAGFTNIGWTNRNGDFYEDNDTFDMGSSDVVLWAKWIPTYTVTYDANGGTGAPTDSTKYTNGQTVTVISNTGGLSNNTKIFAGWTNSVGSNFTGGSYFVMGNENVILYANWTSEPTYRVYYSNNGADSGSVPEDNNNYLDGQTVTVIGNTGGLIKSGFTNIGWTNRNGDFYEDNDTFDMGSSDVVLWAKWIPTYTVTYDANGGTGAPTDSARYTNGQTVTVVAGTPTKGTDIFDGWTNSSGTKYTAGSTFSISGVSETLYARWIPNYPVSYNGNGADGGLAPVDDNFYDNGDTVTVLPNTDGFTKTGFSFAEWNTTPSGPGVSRMPGSTFTIGSSDVVLYARWSINQYTLSFSNNGGTGK